MNASENFTSDPEWLFSFHGRMRSEYFEDGIRADELAESLNARSAAVAEEIRAELERRLPGRFRLQIEFGEGSLTWLGMIEGTLTWMANIGGAIGLTQIIGSTISEVVRRYMPGTPVRPFTNVLMLRVPSHASTTPHVMTVGGPGFQTSPRADLQLTVLMVVSIQVLALLAFILGFLIRR